MTDQQQTIEDRAKARYPMDLATVPIKEMECIYNHRFGYIEGATSQAALYPGIVEQMKEAVELLKTLVTDSSRVLYPFDLHRIQHLLSQLKPKT